MGQKGASRDGQIPFVSNFLVVFEIFVVFAFQDFWLRTYVVVYIYLERIEPRWCKSKFLVSWRLGGGV